MMILHESYLWLLLGILSTIILACGLRVVVLPNLFQDTIHNSTNHLHGSKRPLSLPPGPKPWPLIGNLASLGALPHQALAKLSKIYGPLMYLRLGSVPTIVVSSPEYAELILKTHDKVFASRPCLTSCEIMAYGSQNFGFLPYGDQWRDARRLFTIELLNAKRIENTQKIRKEEILAMLKSMVEESRRGRPVRMFTHFFHLTTNIVTRLMISKRYFKENDGEQEDNEFQVIVLEFFRLFGVFNIGDFIPFLKRFDLQGYQKEMKVLHKKVDAIFQGLLDTRRHELQLGQHVLNDSKEDPEAFDDFMTVMLTRWNQTTGEKVTDDQIKGMLVDVLLAGTDTTAVTLDWTMAELLKNPHILTKCQEELDVVVGRDRIVEESDLPHLPYLLAVVKETFRLHPPGALLLPHESTAPCNVGSYFIPAKSRIIINVWAMGRDTSIWERPLEFDPQRFLPEMINHNDIDVHGRNFQLLPFGSGRRSCPGKNLALHIVHYTLAIMLQCCDWAVWALPHTSQVDEIDMSEKFALAVERLNELQVISTPRITTSVIWK